MNEQKEFIYSIRLIMSQYHRGSMFRKDKSGCSKDFERICKAPENNKEFLDWIQELKNRKILEFDERIDLNKVKEPKKYFVNDRKLLDKLKDNSHYNEAFQFFFDRSIFGIND